MNPSCLIRTRDVRTSRTAMSLLEIMMALSVLTVGIFASMSHFGTLSALRKQATEINAAHTIVAALAERFQGCRWDVIGSSAVPWSLPRPEPGAVTGAAIANPPLMDDVNMTAADRPLRGLQTLGLAQGASGLPELRIYVEFFRSLTARNDAGDADLTRPGIMDREPGGVTYSGIDDFRTKYAFETRWGNIGSLNDQATTQTSVATNRKTYRLDTASVPTSQVGDNDPITIRILATWGDRGQFAVLTARKR